MTIAGLWRYGDWRHVATGCTAIVTVYTASSCRRRRKMYIGHARLCVCPSPHSPHCCTDPDVTRGGDGSGCLLVVHYSADLQSVHEFRGSYDNIARTRNASECLYPLYAWFLFYIQRRCVGKPQTRPSTPNALL